MKTVFFSILSWCLCCFNAYGQSDTIQLRDRTITIITKKSESTYKLSGGFGIHSVASGPLDEGAFFPSDGASYFHSDVLPTMDHVSLGIKFEAFYRRSLLGWGFTGFEIGAQVLDDGFLISTSNPIPNFQHNLSGIDIFYSLKHYMGTEYLYIKGGGGVTTYIVNKYGRGSSDAGNNPTPSTDVDGGTTLDFSAGIGGYIPLGAGFSLNPEIFYSYHPAAFNSLDFDRYQLPDISRTGFSVSLTYELPAKETIDTISIPKPMVVGKVRDCSTYEPLSAFILARTRTGVTIDTAYSSKKGEYVLYLAEGETYIVSVVSPDYRRKDTSIFIPSKTSLVDLDVSLQSEEHDCDRRFTIIGGKAYDCTNDKPVQVTVDVVDPSNHNKKIAETVLSKHDGTYNVRVPATGRFKLILRSLGYWFKVIDIDLGDHDFTQRTFDTLKRFRDPNCLGDSTTLVFFKFSKAVPIAESNDEIDMVAQFLADNPDIYVRIDGHADSVGSDRLNDSLSLRRAESVKRVLVAKYIESKRMQTYGHGRREPVDPGRSEIARQKNRRVVISRDKELSTKLVDTQSK